MEMPDYEKLWSDGFQNENNYMRQYRAESSAKSYDASSKIWEDGFQRAADLPFERTDTVLDIGCGPGVLAIPLASKVRSVVMLDPSRAMLDLAEAHAESRGLTNLISLNEAWEDTDLAKLGEVDYVIASYSLAMRDLRAAIEKMNAVARKGVYLYWFNGVTTWEKISADLRPVIYGDEPLVRGKADVIYGLLSQMGISADVRWRLNLDTDRFNLILNDYLDMAGIYVPENGKWFYRDRTNYVCLSWKTALCGKRGKY